MIFNRGIDELYRHTPIFQTRNGRRERRGSRRGEFPRSPARGRQRRQVWRVQAQVGPDLSGLL